MLLTFGTQPLISVRVNFLFAKRKRYSNSGIPAVKKIIIFITKNTMNQFRWSSFTDLHMATPLQRTDQRMITEVIAISVGPGFFITSVYHRSAQLAKNCYNESVKIGIFDPYLDTLGGGERYMLTAAACLSSEHEVILFWDDKGIVSQASEKLGISLEHIAIAKNIFSRQVPLFQRLIKLKSFNRIIFLSDGSIPFFLSKKLLIHFQFPVPWVNGKSLTTRLKFMGVRRAICNSHYTKHFIDEIFGIKSRVLYPPAMMISNTAIYDKENIILSVGSFVGLPEGGTFKKHELMINAFKKIVDNGVKDWRLVLVGSPLKKDIGYVKNLHSIVHEYPISILENVAFQDLQSIYKKAKIYWHAAGYGEDLNKYPQRAEHFGITTVEAMGYGVVPVVINAGGQKEIVEDGKSGYLWITEEEFIAKTITLMQNVKLRESIGKHARERSKVFTVEKFCQDLKRLII